MPQCSGLGIGISDGNCIGKTRFYNAPNYPFPFMINVSGILQFKQAVQNKRAKLVK